MDTSADAYRLQLAAFRSMTPARRLQIADEMSSAVRDLAEAGLHRRRPDLADEERRADLAEILLGKELAAAARREHSGVDR